MLPDWIRWAGFVVGILMVLGGATVLAAGEATGAQALLFGVVIVAAAVLQRPRYRSAASESGRQQTGPGGGEPGYLEARFLPTTELFVDPTTGRLMRVFVDPRTGERRYRAEG
jgi:hypothetical protein